MKNLFLVVTTIALSLSSAAIRKHPVLGKIQEKSEYEVADLLQKNKEKSISHAASSSDGTVYYIPYYVGDDQTCSSGDEYYYKGNIVFNFFSINFRI